MDLSQVLGAFLSGDNALRAQAEAVYAQEAANPASLLQRLFTYFSERSLDVSARLLCGVSFKHYYSILKTELMHFHDIIRCSYED